MTYFIKQRVFHCSLLLLLTSLVMACDNAKQQPQTSSNSSVSMGKLLGSDDNNQLYHQVLPTTVLTFPDDHQAHNGFRIEWWYITANLTTDAGEQVGIQWTQFRSALSAPDNQPSSTSDSKWATNQLYMAHVALTSKNKHYKAEKFARAHPEFAGVSANPFAVYLDNWQWQTSQASPFPATLTVTDALFGYQLSLDSQHPWQLQGEQGFSIKSRDGQVASHYYSQPYIDVNGTITREGKTENVTGKAWLDREWSSQLLTKSQQGWDWFSIRLDTNTTLMIFRLRGQTETDNFYSARVMLSDGTGRNFTSGSHPNEISMKPVSWHKIKDKSYPVSWQIDIPSEQIHITTDALNPNSEMPLSTPYWEGPIDFKGSHEGMGYMELTGY
ncbi:lipocalin-like domain-containing protein [Shewanella aestuarii]|uniref:Carotenoid 1,2-hydratase n=1 Tax=Shewanella aestuarii TaxID=1028752 RepID=A0A6G9QHQ7_9GAMM|nr:lipocalin-like domain-containing protein [Shewanella aestuarii]QIR13605.1 carotenoid 1,2-hydratase [Shewanella aestuarii]